MNEGRGAWPISGTGGTLKNSTGAPGKYYLLPKDPNHTIGLRAVLFQLAGRTPELNDLAVYHGVVGIQALLHHNQCPVKINGLFDAETSRAVKEFQKARKLTVDGIVGPGTMKALLSDTITNTANKKGVPIQPVYGILANEGAFDPSAVGYYDSNDLGLAQINVLANPGVTFSEAFCPSFAVNYVADRVKSGLDWFGNIEDAIASYNLGRAGTREWINLGRPTIWTPSWADRLRNTQAYIQRILSEKT